MPDWGIVVTIFIFAMTQLILFVRWVNKLSENITALATRFEERTGAMLTDIRKINSTLESLATANNRIERVEIQIRDHELRIREVELKAASNE